ncbi:hypothetical protein tloyanaT_13360 [Thalassotalea loyana]|uniref:Lytic transglycosylase domain-containing protein n=1 Tax=Thalassotalea loyana TaxID=280483 RepID=A0ABQ6HCC4_9GAMM|nr:hypothetical protein [Thalassotalea loyana]GLX85084.1 hypothetical protein tloyanaT_13360 [Thalassotalea loyana]
MSKRSYGLNPGDNVLAMSRQVCDVLGYGSTGSADYMLAETAAAETCLGYYQDPTPNGAGFGLTQFDLIGFEDVKQRARAKHKEALRQELDIDVDAAQLADLNDDPMLSLALTRLKYLLIPEPIPRDFVSRAMYWKRYYNTVAGKGTPKHYLKMAEKYLYHLPEKETEHA